MSSHNLSGRRTLTPIWAYTNGRARLTQVWDFDNSVDQYSAEGGTARVSVAQQIEKIRVMFPKKQ